MQIDTTLRHYGLLLRRRSVLILLGVALCAGLSGLISICTPPVYQARALLKVNTTSSTVSNNDVYNAQALAVDYALLVTSPEVLREAAQKLHSVTSGRLQQAISDSPVENTQIIEVRAQAEEAQLAADMANAVASTFIQQQANREINRLQEAANQLLHHIAQARLDLDTAQEYLNLLRAKRAASATIAQQKSLVDTDQANYTLLLTGYSQLQVQKLQAAGALSIAQRAVPPDRPGSLQPLSSMSLAAAVSLLFIVLLVILLDWLDTTIKTEEDVLNLAGLRPLGSIPAASRAEGAELLNLTMRSALPVREALNALGPNVSAQLAQRGLLLITGVRAGAGVSTVATYLSIALARAGKRVLLVDTNLRRPLLHKVFQTSSTYGLSNRLGDVKLFHEQPDLYPRSWLHRWKTPVTNLWLLPAGTAQVKLTASIPALEQLKAWLLDAHKESGYQERQPLVDFIICDGAPLGEGEDTYTLSALADGIVMVVEAGKEHKEALCEAHALHLQAPIMGVVVNRRRAEHTTYYYAGHYAGRHSAEAAGAQADSQTPGSAAGTGRSKPRQDRPLDSQATGVQGRRHSIPGIHFTAPALAAPRKIAERAATMPPDRMSLPAPNQNSAQLTRQVPKTQFKTRFR